MASITVSLYHSLVIPLLNHVMYRLSTRYFNISRNRPRYISDTTFQGNAESINCLSEGGPVFLGYADPWLEQKESHFDSNEDSSHGMKNGYLDALYAITVSDINPALANAATYQAYYNLCKILRIHIPLAHLLGKCGVCFEPNGKCECYKFKFTYVQHIECTCRFGKYNLCTCDELPEIYSDLDEIRSYQSLIVNQVLSNLIGINADEGDITIIYHIFRLLDNFARRCNDRYDPRWLRILERFRPP